jgi:hypothetical protein
MCHIVISEHFVYLEQSLVDSMSIDAHKINFSLDLNKSKLYTQSP